MRVLVVGATGRTGKVVVKEALERGHTVTALARNPASLTSHQKLNIVKGTPEKEEDIIEAIRSTGEDVPSAVIVTLNAPRESDSPFAKPIGDHLFMTHANENIRAAMKETGVKKIVIMSAFGVAESLDSLNCLMKGVIKYSNMSVQFKDHDRVDAETKESGLNFVMVRPAMLKDTETLPIKDLEDDGKLGSFMPSCSRKSVAKFLVDAAERDTWDGRTPVICN
jgi:putative NADH-flavin reductase